MDVSQIRVAVALIVCVFLSVLLPPAAAEQWKVVLGDSHRNDAAVKLALEDLQTAGVPLGITFANTEGNVDDSETVICVGNPERNPLTAEWVSEGKVKLDGMLKPQGFEIRTAALDQGRSLVVSGGSLTGEVYGLYWLWDRLRVLKTIPSLNVRREPALEIRSGTATTERSLRTALRYTSNWVMSLDTNSLVPWDEEPLKSENALNRASAQSLIDYAHALHVKVLTYADEFSFLPSQIEARGATLSPADPQLWQLLQEKYRLLFRTMPDIDGVCIRTGELTRVVEPLKPYDVIHEPPLPDWPLELRYQTFIKTLHEVVVGEFGKLYYHRTWVTNTTEQHSNPDVYRAIFADDVPRDNLYLSPYLTKGDRWFYQPVNPTFNLTPHRMLVLLAPMNYHEGGDARIFPTYPGLYFREGLDRIWQGNDGNVAGSQFGSVGGEGWGSNELTAYAALRMSWDPSENPRTIAEDFAAIHFGRDAAKTMGEIIMLSGEAYKHGLYVKPVAESTNGNTLPQLRLTTFVLQGMPDIDHGKEHLRWLHDTLYRPSKPNMSEALEYLDKGLELSAQMEKLGGEAQASIPDAEQRGRVLDSLKLTRLLIATNNAYVKTCFDYFDYREKRSEPARERLRDRLDELVSIVSEFRAAPGFDYKLYGVDQLIQNASEVLEDLNAAEARLDRAPDADVVLNVVKSAQEKERRALEDYSGKAVKILHWKVMVDGKDVLQIRGDKTSIEHLMSDPIQFDESEWFAPLPAENVSVIVRDLRSTDVHPFVLEQPRASNDFTAKVYLFDSGPGYGLWEFEVYYLPDRPEMLGLKAPWQD